MPVIDRFSTSPSKTFLAANLAILFGVSLGIIFQDFMVLFLFLAASFGFSFIGLVIFWRAPKRRLIFICLLLAALGALRVGGAPQLSEHLNFNDDLVIFDGVVANDPVTRGRDTQLILKTVSYGKIAVSVRDNENFFYGDSARARCVLRELKEFSFSYRAYLLSRGVVASCAFGSEVNRLASGEHSIKRSLIEFKHKFIASLRQALPPPHSALAVGVLLGNNDGLTKEVLEPFRRTGAAHIVAISGYNIAVIFQVIFSLLTLMLFPRRAVFAMTLIALAAFVFITGAEASVIRAAIMGTLVLLSRQVGRLSHSYIALVFAAALMILHNPFLLFFDVGFQLSFMATLGLIVFSPLLSKRLKRVPNIISLRQTISDTVAASLFTLPVSLWHFGSASAVSPLVNVLILWAVPPLMAVSFLVGLFGMMAARAASFLAIVPWALAEWIFKIASFFAPLPFITITAQILTVFVIAFGAAYAAIHFLRLRANRAKSLIASYEITVE